MGTIVFTHDVPNKNFDIKSESRTHATTRFSIWVADGKVTITESEYLTGINFKNADRKRWWRWRSQAAFGFMRTKTGLAQPFEVKRPNRERGGGWTNVSPRRAVEALVSDEVGDAYSEHVHRAFGFSEFNQFYPMAAQYGITKFGGMPIGIRSAFREKSPEDFTKRIFGVKRLNGELVSAVTQADPYFIASAQQYRGYVHDKALVEYLVRQRFDDLVLDHIDSVNRYAENHSAMSPSIRKTLAMVNKETVGNLINQEVNRPTFSQIAQISGINRMSVKNRRPVNVRSGKVYSDWNALLSDYYW